MPFILVSFLISICATLVAAKLFSKKFVWWEYVTLFSVPFAISGFIYYFDTTSKTQDVEYFSNQTVKVEYYEYYETYVHETCTRTYSCNCTTDAQGNQSCSTCTETYDCSYCDENPAVYIAYDESGHSQEITESEYRRIAKKFGNERFENLNRNITYYGGCGKDGDKFVATWDGDYDNKFEIFVVAHNYENKIRLSESYGFRELTPEEQSRIHNYPSINGVYQPSITGGWYQTQDYRNALYLLDRFNGQYGKAKQIKAFIFTYYNQDPTVADLQKIFFQNGNKNEIILCVGYSGNSTQWVKAFSWTDEKICENEAIRYFSPNMTLTGLVEHMIPVWKEHWVRKQFTPYNEIISIQPSTSAWIWMVVLNLVVCGMLTFVFTNNDHEDRYYY